MGISYVCLKARASSNPSSDSTPFIAALTRVFLACDPDLPLTPLTFNVLGAAGGRGLGQG